MTRSVVHLQQVDFRGCESKQCYIGSDAQSNREILALRYPIQYGYVTDWDDMALLWHHVLHHKLKYQPEEHQVLLSEPPFNPKINRERMTEIMFEMFDTPGLYIANQQAMSVYASGYTTGLVVDLGDGASFTVPVYEGYALTYAARCVEPTGFLLTDFLARMLSSCGHSFDIAEYDIVRNVKESKCYVAQDFEREINSSHWSNLADTSYILPDGQLISIGDERFKCPEALFQPSLLNQESIGIHEQTLHSIMRCDADIHKQLYGHVMLSGGSTMFPGLSERLHKELSFLAPSDVKVECIALADRIHTTWVGGSVIASLPTFPQMCMTKEEYDEYGPTIVHRHCF